MKFDLCTLNRDALSVSIENQIKGNGSWAVLLVKIKLTKY